jgi:hypothetical protein
MKVRKKTFTVEAWQHDGTNQHQLIRILDEHDQEFMPVGNTIQLHTPDGELLLQPGDYLIKGNKGNFYTCKPNIFDDNYEIKGIHYE